VFNPIRFRHRDVRSAVAQWLGRAPNQCVPAQTTCDLRRLRLHPLIERVPHAQEQLNRADVGPGFQRWAAKQWRSTQYMWRETSGEAGASLRAAACLLQGATADRVVPAMPGKQPSMGSAQARPVPQHREQHREQHRREHHTPIPLAFVLLDANHHSLTVEIAEAESDGLPRSGAQRRSKSSGRRDAWATRRTPGRAPLRRSAPP
jgi:hypothetical protein